MMNLIINKRKTLVDIVDRYHRAVQYKKLVCRNILKEMNTTHSSALFFLP